MYSRKSDTYSHSHNQEALIHLVDQLWRSSRLGVRCYLEVPALLSLELHYCLRSHHSFIDQVIVD